MIHTTNTDICKAHRDDIRKKNVLIQFLSPDDEHDVLETCRDLHIKINTQKGICVSRWSFTKNHYMMHGQQNVKEKENWRILTNKEIYASVKKPTIIETIRLNRLCWFGHVQRMEENRIPKRVLYMSLGTTRLRGRPRNRWQDGVREDGRIVGGEGWQEKST